jgi:drug/metabolite transporter (DMT)-like permease
MTNADAKHDQPLNEKLGIFWMLGAMMIFSVTNSFAKLLMANYTVIQIVWARYFFQFVLLIIFLGPSLKKMLATNRLLLQIVRSLLLLCTSVLFFFGLSKLALADISSIMFVAPILVTILSMPLLGERAGPRRWAGIIIGFLGAIIIIRPGYGMIQYTALFPLGAACLYALYQISTRFLGRTDNAMTTLLYTASSGTTILTSLVPLYWKTPDTEGWMMMALLGVTSNLGHFSLIKAYEHAPAPTVVPFTYANLLWMTLFGYILFSDLPDLWTISGACIVAGSGLYIFHRENKSHISNGKT